MAEAKSNWLAFLQGRGKEATSDSSSLGAAGGDKDAPPPDDQMLADVRQQFFQAIDLGGLEELYLTLSRLQFNSMDLLFSVRETPEYRTCMDLVISKSGQDNIKETPLAAWYLKNGGLSEGVFTPLHIVARNGHADLVTLLLRQLTANVGKNQMTVMASYINKTTCSSEGLTALHLAVYSPLRRVDSNTKQDSTPGARKLMEDLMALNNCMGDRIACIETLVANGARVNVKAEIPGLYGSRGTPLHMACVAFCHPDTIQALLTAGADVHADIVSEDPNLNGASALHLAVRVGLLYEEPNVLLALRVLLAGGADPYQEAAEGTPLHLACKYGYGSLACAVIQILAEAMAHPTAPPAPAQQDAPQARRGGAGQDQQWGGAAVATPRRRGVGSVKEAVNLKAGGVGMTPLQYAAMNSESEEEVVDELVRLGAEIGGEAGALALLLAMQYEDVDLAKTKWLLDMGVSSEKAVEVAVPGEATPRSLTPVQWAFHAVAGFAKCEQPREVLLEILKVMLEYHQELPAIPLDPQGTSHASPMLFALRYFDLECLGTVMVAGDDLNDCYEVGSDGARRRHNPIMAVLERPDVEDMDGLIGLLVEAGADVTQPSQLYRGGGPLHVLSNGQEALVQPLVGMGLGINDLDDNLDTPLACACQRGQMHVARMLMLNSGKVDTHNKQGRTPLHLICRAPHSPHHLSMARSLLKAGADPNAKDLDGRTPLDYAKQVNSQDAVALLERFRRLQDAQAKASQQRKLDMRNPTPSTLLNQVLHNIARAPSPASAPSDTPLSPAPPITRRNTPPLPASTNAPLSRYSTGLPSERATPYTSIPISSTS